MADVDDDVSSSSPLLLGVASFAGLACLLLPAAVMATRRRDKAGGGDGRHDDDGGEEVTVDFGGTATTTPRPPLPRNATDATSPATTDDGGAAAAASPYSRDDSLAAVLADFEDASSPAKPRRPGSPPDATSSSPAATPGAEDDELAAVVRGVLEKRRASRRGRVAERAGGGEAGAASSPAAPGRRDDDDDDGEMTPFDQRRDEDAGAADDFLRGPVRSGSPGRRHGGERVDAEAAAPDLERAAPSTGGGMGAPVPSPASPHYDLPVPFRAPRSSALRLAAPPLLGSLYRALSRNAIVAVVATYAGTTHLCALFLAQHLLWDLASCGPRGLAAASSAVARGALARGTPALAGQHALLASMASLPCVGIAGTLWGLVGGDLFLALGLGDEAAAELVSRYSRAILASAFARHVATDPVLGLLGADGHSTFVASVEAFRVVGGVAATVVAVPIMGGGIVEVAWGFGAVDAAAALVASAVPWGLGWTSKFRAAGVCTSVVMAVKSTRSRNDVLSNGAKMALSNLLEFSEIRGLTFFGVYLGYRPVASWAVASTLWDTLTTLAESIGDIAWIRVSSHLSKNNRRTGERCAYRFVAWGMAVSVVMSVLLGTVGYPICGLLSGGHDAEVKALAEELLPFLSIANIAMAAAVLCRAVLGAASRGRGRGAGAPVSAVLTNAAVWAISVPFASVFCLVLDFGLAGLAAGAAVGWILSAFVATYHLLLLADWNPYRRVGGGGVGKKQPVSEADAVNDEAPDDGAHRGHDDVLPNWSEDLMPAPPPTTTAATTGERRAVAKVSPKRVSPPKGDIASEDRHAERERDDSLTRRVQRVIEQAEGRRQHQPSSNQLQPNSNPANTSPPSNVEDGKLMGGKMAQIVEEQRVSTAGDSSSRRGVPPPPPPPHATGEAGGGARELFPIGDRAPPPREAFTLPSPPPRRDGQRVGSDTLATRKTGDEVPKTSSPEKSMVPSFDPYDYGGVDDSNLEYDTEESHSEAAGVPPPRIPPPPPPQSKVQSHSSVDYEDDGDIPLRTGADGINNIRRSMSDAVSFPSQSEIRPDRSVDCNSGIDFETERGGTGPQADADTVHTRNLSEVNSARSVSRTRSNRSFDYLSFDNEEEAGGDIPPQADADTVHVRNFTFNEGASSFASAPTQSWTGSNIRSFDDESLEHISISRRAGPESVVIRNLNDAASASVSRTHSTVREEDIPVRADTSTVDAGNLNRAATESLAQSTISNRPKDYEDSEYAQSSVGGGRDEDAGDDDDDEKDADDATENDDDEHDSDSDDDDDRDKRLHRTRTEESSVGDDNETDCTQAAADSDGEDSDDEEAPPASSAGPRILEDGPKVGGGGQQLPSLQPWWATKSTMPNADDSFQQ